jgi:hypothetical protein
MTYMSRVRCRYTENQEGSMGVGSSTGRWLLTGAAGVFGVNDGSSVIGECSSVFQDCIRCSQG